MRPSYPLTGSQYQQSAALGYVSNEDADAEFFTPLYVQGHLLAEVRANGIINTEQHTSEGTLITAHVAKHSSLLQEVARHAVSTYKLRSSVGVPVSNGATLSERQTE